MKKRFILIILTCVGIFCISMLDFSLFSKKEGCPFCNNQVIENQVLYKKKKALALFTHKPAVKGHILIIPSRHVERFEELSEEEVLEISELIKIVDGLVKKRVHSSDYLLLQKNGKRVGQSVPHLHFHYIPESRLLALKFLLSPWLKPLGKEQLLNLKKEFLWGGLEAKST